MQELEKYFQYFPIFIIAFVSSFLLTPLVGYLARKLEILDLPPSMKKAKERGIATAMHDKPVTKLGGLAVVIPIIFIILYYLPIDKELLGLISGLVILTIAGYLDDKLNLPGATQFLFQVIAALVIVLTGTGIETLRNPIGNDINLVWTEIPFYIKETAYHLSLPSDLITIAWIILVINSMNWVAGIDGLVEGLTGISALIITLLSVRFFTHPTAVMGAALAGAVLGFLPYNFNPAKIFSGSIGDYVYGFFLAVLSIYSGAKFATALMLLGIPILDAVWVILYRINLFKPKNLNDLWKALLASDKIHLHHRLLEMGLSVKQVNYFEYSVVAFLGIIAFLLTGLLKTLFLFISLVLGIALILYTTQKSNKDSKPPGRKVQAEESPEKKFAY